MKVCLAQVRSETGDVQRNIDRHLAALETLGPADLVVFPELSLSNYAPDVAGAVAVAPTDHRLVVFQRYADQTGTAVAVGAPLATAGLPVIGLLVFEPGRDVAVVGKRYLHADEAAFFSPSGRGPGVLELAERVGVAICYEITVAEHTASVMAAEPALHLASVAKTPGGIETAHATLAQTARRYGVPTLVVNSVGTCEGQPAGGRSAAFDRDGRRLGQLDGSAEGVLIADTQAGTVTTLALGPQR